MGKNNKKVPEINSSSMADISFLLLIFFLVTTTMATDKGLTRRLPPIPEKKDKTEVEVNKRNVMNVLLNSNNQLMVQGKIVPITKLRETAKEFIVNPRYDAELPERVPTDIPNFGTYDVTRDHIISLQNDRGTEYQAYIEAQNELVGAYNEVREELAMEKWGVSFSQLNEDRKEAIRQIFPQHISEAEPKNYGGK